MLRGVALIFFLAVWNSGAAMLLRWVGSKSEANGGPKADVQDIIFLTEFTKFCMVVTVLAWHKMRNSHEPVLAACLPERKFSSYALVAAPAIGYYIQNNFSYLAARCLDATSFFVVLQSRTLWGLLIWKIVFAKTIGYRKIGGVLLLLSAIGSMRLSQAWYSATKHESASAPKNVNSCPVNLMSTLTLGLVSGAFDTGILLVSVASFASSLSGVLVEYVMKTQTGPAILTRTELRSGEEEDAKALKSVNRQDDDDDDEARKGEANDSSSSQKEATSLSCSVDSVWMNNIKLAIASLTLAVLTNANLQAYLLLSAPFSLFLTTDAVANDRFMVGVDPIVWTAILYNAVGGIIIGFVLRYSDVITKDFAQGMGTVIVGFCSVYVFAEVQPNALFFLGLGLVTLSITTFNAATSAEKQTYHSLRKEDERKSALEELDAELDAEIGCDEEDAR